MKRNIYFSLANDCYRNSPANLLRAEIPEKGYNFEATNYVAQKIADETPDCAFIDTVTFYEKASTNADMADKFIQQHNQNKNIITGELDIFPDAMEPQKSNYLILDSFLINAVPMLGNPKNPVKKVVIPLTLAPTGKAPHGTALCLNIDEKKNTLNIILLEQHAKKDGSALDYSQEVQQTLGHIKSFTNTVLPNVTVETVTNKKPISEEKNCCGIVSMYTCQRLLEADNPIERVDRIVITPNQIKRQHLENHTHFMNGIRQYKLSTLWVNNR